MNEKEANRIYFAESMKNLCRQYVHTESDGEAEEIRIEIELTLANEKLPSLGLIKNLKEERKDKLAEGARTEEFTCGLRGLCMEYVLIEDNDYALKLRGELEKKLEQSGLASPTLLVDLERKRRILSGCVERYLTTTDEKERENYRTILAYNLRKSGFAQQHITGFFESLESEKVYMREGRPGKK